MSNCCLVLSVRSPLFTTSTDCLIGAVPAAMNPTTRNWYFAHALELTVCGDVLGIRNSGWRANPHLLVIDAEPSGDPVGAALYLLRAGFYVAFCGLADAACPSAGLIYGAVGKAFRAVISMPDGTAGRVSFGFGALERGTPRALRGIRVRSAAVPFDAAAATDALTHYLDSPERARAVRLFSGREQAPGDCALRTLAGQRRAVLGALLRLDPTGGTGACYRREVLLPAALGVACLADSWRAEERILSGWLLEKGKEFRSAGGGF